MDGALIFTGNSNGSVYMPHTVTQLVSASVRYRVGLSMFFFFFVFKIFYCVSQNHIQSTYTYTYSLSPEVSWNANLIIAQFICNTVQRQVSCNRQIITLTYIMFISTKHSMCTLCHITDTDDHILSYNSDHFIRNCSCTYFGKIYIASKTSILFFNICKNFKKNILSPFLFGW